jgi:hypothetical protein
MEISMSGNPRERIKLRIQTQLEASKQFLVVLIGLAVTNGVAEKLKYGLDGTGFGLIKMEGIPERREPITNYIVSGSDMLYETMFNGRSSLLNIMVLLVFFLYTTRFFFNNYTYLSEIYGEGSVEVAENEKDKLLSLKFSSLFDLVLSVFTGIIVCLVSMVLTQKRVVILLAFLMLHYIIDALVLGFWTVRTLITDRERNDLRLCWRAGWWIVKSPSGDFMRQYRAF